jgi:hypothetical protein
MAGRAITTLAPAIVLAVMATSADSTYPTRQLVKPIARQGACPPGNTSETKLS